MGVTMSSTAVDVGWRLYEGEDRHVQAAAQHLYVLGVLAARQGTRISYPEAAESLFLAGHGFSYHRSLCVVLDALSALCSKLRTPDVTAVFWPSDGADRWTSVGAKLAAERACRAHPAWPSLVGV